MALSKIKCSGIPMLATSDSPVWNLLSRLAESNIGAQTRESHRTPQKFNEQDEMIPGKNVVTQFLVPISWLSVLQVVAIAFTTKANLSPTLITLSNF